MSLSLQAGAAAPWVFKVRAIGALALLFSLLSVPPYMMAFGGAHEAWSESFGAPLLVTSVSLLRFVEAYMTTMIFVVVGERFGEERARVSRLIGVVDRGVVTVGSLLSIALVGVLGHQGDGVAQSCF